MSDHHPSPAFLKKGGALIMEMGIGQSATLIAMAGPQHASRKWKDLVESINSSKEIVERMKTV
jgi:hypothetical protein